jgi:hypothetical protein
MEQEKKFEVLDTGVRILYGPQSEKRYSYADYLTWKDHKYREIVDGIAKPKWTPTVRHTLATFDVAMRMKMHIRANKWKYKLFIAPFDVCLPKNGETANDKIHTVVQPDICIICDPSKIIDDKRCLGAPDLVVESLSIETMRWDVDTKFNAYEEAGVREYWFVYPEGDGLVVFRLQDNGKFDDGTAYEIRGIATSSVLPGLEIDLDDLFEDCPK